MKNLKISLQTKSLLILISGLALMGCTKMPVYQSEWYNEQTEDNLLNYTAYETKAQLRYSVSNNDSLLFLKFTTDHAGVQRNILRQGAQISFNLEGKKKCMSSLHYPFIQKKKEAVIEFEREVLMLSARRSRSVEFKNPTTALWKRGEAELWLDHTADAHGFQFKMSRDKDNRLHYRVAIPLKSIYPQGMEALNLLTVGIEIKAMERRVPKPGMQNGRKGGRGGGMGGRVQGMGGRGQTMRSRSKAGKGTPARDVKIWFQVELKKRESSATS